MQSETREAKAINNSVLRRHFRELTLALLQPFQAYLTREPGSVAFPPFNMKDFLHKMKNQQTIFPLLRYTSRRKALSLYENFLSSPVFTDWFAVHRQRFSSLANREL